MSERLLKNVVELANNIEKNSAYVEQTLSTHGRHPDPAIVISAAKYREALERLAHE